VGVDDSGDTMSGQLLIELGTQRFRTESNVEPHKQQLGPIHIAGLLDHGFTEGAELSNFGYLEVFAPQLYS